MAQAKRIPTSFISDAELSYRLKRCSRELRKSVSEVICELVTEWLAKEEPKVLAKLAAEMEKSIPAKA